MKGTSIKQIEEEIEKAGMTEQGRCTLPTKVYLPC